RNGPATSPSAGPSRGVTRTRRRRPLEHGRWTMNVAVFGLGYVGSVSAAALAGDGHQVIGVDVNDDKVASLNAGRSPIVGRGLEGRVGRAAGAGAAGAPPSTAEAVEASDLSLVCVGTPSRRNGSLDLTYLTRVCEQIGEALRTSTRYHVVV